MADILEVKFDAEDLTYATAMVLSQIALPAVGARTERGALYDSLCAWMLRERAQRDPAWADDIQPMVPRLALRPDADIRKDLRRFDRLIRDRLTAGHIAVAFLRAIDGEAAPALPAGVERLSLNELAASVLDIHSDWPLRLRRPWRLKSLSRACAQVALHPAALAG